MIKSTFLSGLASASSLASNTLSMSSSRHSKSPGDDEILSTIEELGMNDDKNIAERDAVYESYSVIVGRSNVDNDSIGVTIEKFVIEMLKKGHSPQWSDAAFRAFDTRRNGYLNKYEYLLSICALKTIKEMHNNPIWIKLRRRVLFAYYDRDNRNQIDSTQFHELLNDLSATTDDPEVFGITNKGWKRNQSNNTKVLTDHSHDALSQVRFVTVMYIPSNY